MRFGIGYHPKYLTIYDDSEFRSFIIVSTIKEALEIIKALKNYFGLAIKEDPMTQEEATKFMKELEDGWRRRT